MSLDSPLLQILDGSDVLQQISNVTSTEPSNEREVGPMSASMVSRVIALYSYIY